MTVLGAIGGLVFALWMCMCLIAEWNAFVPGVIAIIIGAILLLALFPVYRKDHPKYTRKKKSLDKHVVTAVCIGILAMFLLGVEMCLTLTNSENMMLDIVLGVIGLIGCILNFPIYQYLKDNN